MNKADSIAAAKPYLIGAAIGAVAISIIGFSGGLVVSTGTMASEVQAARVATLSEVCAAGAKKHWLDGGNEMAALEGWDNEAPARNKLAEEFTPTVAEIDSIRGEIVEACGDALRPA